jgi:hypothetical protein
VYARVTTYADEIKAQLPTTSNGAIALSADGLPAGATASFAPSSVDAGGSSTLTIATSSATPAGAYKVTVTGKSAQHTHTATITLTVQQGSSGPVTVADPGFQFVHNQTVNLSLKASGGTGTYTWSATGLPPGLSLDPTTGVITGRPTATGQYSSPVTATDTAGTSGKVTVNWFVY